MSSRSEMERPLKRRRTDNSALSIKVLPDEVLSVVLGHLDVVSGIQLRRVTKKWDAMLRDPAVWQTIKLSEQLCRTFDPLADAGLLKNLLKAGVFKHVKNLVLEGDYDLADQNPHGCYLPCRDILLFPTIINKIKESCDFKKLERIVVRNAPVDLETFFSELTGPYALKCLLTVENGSIVLFDGDDDAGRWCVEFEIPESRTFDLSGNTASLHVDLPVVRVSKGCEHSWIPKELAEFVAERCNAVSGDAVAELGDLYSDLLKGREGMIIRDELRSLFREFVSAQNGGYEPNIKHWEQCRDYDFNSVGNWQKYALVYYARPRNCYKVDLYGYLKWDSWRKEL